jgi:hypothetical protein
MFNILLFRYLKNIKNKTFIHFSVKKYGEIINKKYITEFYPSTYNNVIKNLINNDEMEKYIFGNNINNIEFEIKNENDIDNLFQKHKNIISYKSYKYNNINIKVENNKIYDKIKKYNIKKISINGYENDYILKKNEILINDIIKNSDKDIKFKIYLPCYLFLNCSYETRQNDVFTIINKIEQYYHMYDNLEEICLVNNSEKMSYNDFKSIIDGIKLKIPLDFISFQNNSYKMEYINKKLFNYCLDNNINKFNVNIFKNRYDIKKGSIILDKEYKLYELNKLIETYEYEKKFNKKDFL